MLRTFPYFWYLVKGLCSLAHLWVWVWSSSAQYQTWFTKVFQSPRPVWLSSPPGPWPSSFSTGVVLLMYLYSIFHVPGNWSRTGIVLTYAEPDVWGLLGIHLCVSSCPYPLQELLFSSMLSGQWTRATRSPRPGLWSSPLGPWPSYLLLELGCLCIYNSIFQVPGYWTRPRPVQFFYKPGVCRLLGVQGLAGGLHLRVPGCPHPLLELGCLQQIYQCGSPSLLSAGVQNLI